jgi:L-ascorbate metabolism protein UlaG (beta-lactamase superfamily)
MNRRNFFKWSGFGVFSLGINGCTDYLNAQKQNHYYSGPVTDHFDGTFFYNKKDKSTTRISDLLKWKLLEKRAVWPENYTSIYSIVSPKPSLPQDETTVTMVGHATLLIQMGGLNILTDPVYSEHTSPIQHIGPKRHNPPGIPFEALPKIDVILVTHNHYDHLDLQTLDELVTRDYPKIYTPLGNDTIIQAHIKTADIQIGDWGDEFKYNNELKISFEPCQHWSARGIGDQRMALWAAFVLESSNHKVYHVGDTGFGMGNNYREVAKKYGGFDLAILPIGAYEPRWFMKPSHQNPREAVTGLQLCKARYGLGHHWGTFQLANEEVDAPKRALTEALKKQLLSQDRFIAMRPGQVWKLPI